MSCDSTLSTFRWAGGYPFASAYSDHKYVNWEKLDSWARKRTLDMNDPSIIDLPSS